MRSQNYRMPKNKFNTKSISCDYYLWVGLSYMEDKTVGPKTFLLRNKYTEKKLQDGLKLWTKENDYHPLLQACNSVQFSGGII